MRNWMMILVCMAIAVSTEAQVSSVQGSASEKNRAFKVDPFSPFTGKLTLGYEQKLISNMNLDADFGIIGPNVFTNDRADAKGFFIKAGPRFYTHPDFFTDDMKRYSDFQGFYFMPTVGYTQYAYTPLDLSFEGSDERRTQQAGSILLNIGRQWAVGDMVLLDIGGGIGYGFASESARIKNFSHSGDNFIGSLTVSIGFLTR